VPASKERERRLARAKIERQMARRAEQAVARRRRRAWMASGLAIVVVALVLVYSFGGFHALFGKKATNAANDNTTTCVWASGDTGNAALKDVGTPAADNIPTTGTDTMTITTNRGTVTVTLDRQTASCAAASFEYLAGKRFFDNTQCTGLVTKDPYLLQCGDPTSPPSTVGGPSYTFAADSLPVDYEVPSGAPSPSPGSDAPSEVIYPAGTVAMAPPNKESDSNGSQFFIVYKDSVLAPQYSVIGKVASGLDVVTKIAAGGTVAAPAAGLNTAPKLDVTIKTLTVVTNQPAASAPASGSPTPSPTSPSAGASP
jgi:peptidyl-prolyl cis-trans isomerase B (cyclophilin B)